MAKKVLVIEDDLFLGDLLAQKFRGAGYDILVATDGQSGLEKLSSFKPNIVLLDIILPVMNGFDVLKAKAKDENISKIPVIILTNSGDQNDKSAFEGFNVKEILIKAKFDPSAIVKHIDKVMDESENLGTSSPVNTSMPTRPIIETRKIEESKIVVNTEQEAPLNPKEIEISKTPSETADTKDLLKQKKIMWVEDDKFLSDLISRKLANLGCQVVYAETGEIALTMVEKEKPDIILLDILLPGITGIEVLEKIKANPMVSKIPVMMLSNFSQETDIKKSLSLGAVKYLVKATVTLDEIVTEIKNILVKATAGK